MKCLILAAGYATRLYPLTNNFPKPLLKIKEKTILDWLVDDINSMKVIDEFIIISNHKYVDFFVEWANKKNSNIKVVDDGTSTNESRLGAVKDIQYVIDKLHIDSDMLVIAGDNVLDFSLTKFINYAINKRSSCVMRYFEEDKSTLPKRSTIIVNSDDLIIDMEEKPKKPKSNWCCPPFYYYTREDSKKIIEAIENGCNTDAPGSFISWLSKISNVYAMEMPGKRFDIGSIESYEKVKKEYRGII